MGAHADARRHPDGYDPLSQGREEQREVLTFVSATVKAPDCWVETVESEAAQAGGPARSRSMFMASEMPVQYTSL